MALELQLLHISLSNVYKQNGRISKKNDLHLKLNLDLWTAHVLLDAFSLLSLLCFRQNEKFEHAID